MPTVQLAHAAHARTAPFRSRAQAHAALCRSRAAARASTALAALGLMLSACSAKDIEGTGATTSDGGAVIAALAGGGAAAGAIGGSAVGGAAGGSGTPGGVSSGGGSNVTQVPGQGITPITLDQCGATNPGGLSAAQVAALKAGGNPGSMRVLYPYDGTVFPRGLSAPTVMWEGSGSDGIYVHLKATNFEYHGCLRANAAGQLQLPQDVWDKAGQQTGGGRDPLSVEFTTLNGQNASGPIKLRWVIAQATLKGSVYYNSYNTQLGGGFGVNGAILRLRPGRGAEVFARQGSCTGCHSLSANGERLISTEIGIGLLGNDPLSTIGSLLGGVGGAAGGGIGGVIGSGPVFSIGPDTAPNPTPVRIANGSSFAGFTPDGKLLVFTDGGQGGRAIVLMDFDLASKKASNPRTLATNSNFLGWPFVLPDNRAVVFSVTDGSNYSGGGVAISPIIARGPLSDLMLVDVVTKKTMWLAKAVGFNSEADMAANKTYLPFGAEELHQHYYPTVSPVSGGGYFWLFFDSVRRYGNQGSHRQLWGAAISIAVVNELSTGQYESDPSFPAFYLAGQELPVANHRAFTALDPCRKDGAMCETGIDCCNGFCTNGVCGRQQMRCSETNEACKTKSDCCRASDQCIGGFCGVVLE